MKHSVKMVQFTNFSNEDFSHQWDSVPYQFRAGQTIYIEDWKAAHFAKHLIDRELIKKNIPTDRQLERSRLLALCITDSSEVIPESKVESEIANKNNLENKSGKQAMECCGSMGTRHKKDCVTLQNNSEINPNFEA